MPNAIAIENAKPGNPQSQWGLQNGASSAIEGFTADMSYNLGQTVDFKINTNAASYRIEIYRLGYYNGDGARLVGTLQHSGATNQPAPLTDIGTGLVDAGNWSITDSWTIPSDLVSGVYLAKLVREDGTAGENHIPFVVRNDQGNSDIVLKTSDETWQAYNPWGGNSVYEGGDVAVSYNRPIITAYDNAYAETRPWNYLFGEEYAAIRWLERNGFDVSYVAGVDLARNGASLLTHKAFISAGHDEYWSAEQRSAVETARDSGVNLLFWSGNEVYWKTRWGESIDGDAYRTLITYKETNKDAKVDPSTEWTGLWRDSRFLNGTESVVPENALTGTFYWVDYDRNAPLHSLVLTSDFADLPLWRNTAVANLQPGQSLEYPELIGYEWDVVANNGYNPATLISLSSTTVQSDAVLQDQYAKVLALDSATHSLTLYKADSGALVFGAGTVMWAWALDDVHALGPNGTGANGTAQTDIQQAMINLLADMGIAPETLQYGLVQGGSFGDVTAPVVTSATTSDSNYQIMSGDSIYLSGTAADGDGHLAGVMVSGDNGTTWARADGTTSWSLAVHVGGSGVQTIQVKAFDTSFNMSNAWSTGVTVAYAMTGALSDFAVAQGWTNTAYKRIFADLDGDGVKDLLGFGQEATLGYFGATDGSPAFRTPGVTNVVLADFASDQGYSASSVRGADFLGSFVAPGSKAAVIWGQTATGIVFHLPTAVSSDMVAYDSSTRTLSAFGTSSGWTAAHSIDVGFVAGPAAPNADAYGSVFGFGDNGLLLAREAFSPNITAAAVLVGGSEAFGNDAGWSSHTDLRCVRDYEGNIIDLNHDGVVDVLALGQQGTVYALGQLTDNGVGGTNYSLGLTIVAPNGPDGQNSDFGSQQGWTKDTSLRAVMDVNSDGYVDIIGFGDAGVMVSQGRAPAFDGSGAFAPSYLALADYGTASGWGASDHVREFGDVNGDGVVDIVGFGDDSSFVALGSIDAFDKISWKLSGIIGDFGIAEGWSSAMHMRSVVDLNGDGKVELFASGDDNTRLVSYI